MNINSYMPVRVISGKDCLKRNEELLISRGKRCLILTGKSSAKLSGALDTVTYILDKNNIDYSVFDEIEPNPLTATCKKAGDEAFRFGAEYIIGIGGGSVLDAAKAVAIFAVNQDFSHADVYSRIIPSAHLPVILIGTTSGTGSEVTGVSVLTNSDTGLKKSISGADCYADIAFCDYSYTKSTNTDVRISAALDAFCHAVEAFLASSANDMVEMYVKEAISILAPYILSGEFCDICDEDFEKLYVASIYAGLAINIAGTDFPHTVGYHLTEAYGISHGKACAVFMPELLDRAKKYCPEKLGTILEIVGSDIETLSRVVRNLADVNVCISREEAIKISLRWKNGVKNFDRTPGGFSYEEAEKALLSLNK